MSSNKAMESNNNFMKITNPSKKPVVALFKKSNSESMQNSNGINLNTQGGIINNQLFNPQAIDTQNKQPQSRLGTSHSQKHLLRGPIQQPGSNLINFGGTQINLNGINNFGLMSNLGQNFAATQGGQSGNGFGNQLNMGSTLTSAGVIYNQNLKQKLSGSGSVLNLGGGSGIKSGKIKAEYFKTQIKNGSGFSSNTFNNNTGSVQHDTQQDSEGVNPQTNNHFGTQSQKDSTNGGTSNHHGYWSSTVNSNNHHNIKNEINNPLYFIFNNIVQIQPAQQPQFINGIFGSSIGNQNFTQQKNQFLCFLQIQVYIEFSLNKNYQVTNSSFLNNEVVIQSSKGLY